VTIGAREAQEREMEKWASQRQYAGNKDMWTSLEIVLSFAVLPVFGLLEYVWMRVMGLRSPGIAACTIHVCKMLRVLAPLIAFLGTSIRYVGAKAKMFVPEEPPRAIELIWMPAWAFAAVWVVMIASRRAARKA
jgi:hypothetical protein